MKNETYILIDQMKTDFILSQISSTHTEVVSTTKNISLSLQSSNRVLKVVGENSNLFTAFSTGKLIHVDGCAIISKHKIDDNDFIIHYKVKNNTLDYKIIDKYTTICQTTKHLQVKKNDDSENRPKRMKAYGTVFENGFLITIANNIEKICYFTISDNIIGKGNLNLFNIFSYSQQTWPELELEMRTKNQYVTAFMPKHVGKHFDEPGVYKIHRNWNADNVKIAHIYKSIF